MLISSLGRGRRLGSLIVGLLLAVCVIATLPAQAAEKQASSDGWPEITPEERKLTSVPQDPDADAVVLRTSREGRIVAHVDEWVNELKFHWRMKILKPSGKHYSEVHIRAAKYSRVGKIEARTVKADGTVVPVTPDQVFEKVVFQLGDFKLTERVFSFPAVEPGAILEYRYDRYDNLLYFVDPWYFEGPEFTLQSRVSQAVPDGANYGILCELCGASKPAISPWREGKQQGQIYALEMKDLPGYREEVLMPPRRESSPRLEMVLQGWKDQYWKPLGRQDKLFTDWASVGKYVSYAYEGAIKTGQATLQPVVEDWVKGIADPQEKVRAVFRHVQQDFRYLSFTQVVGYARPIAKILSDKTADNEEKAVLLVAALRSAGVESYPVLVSGRDAGGVNPKFFSLSQFTHVVAALPRPDGSALYLDPTVSYSALGFMPWRDSGADALLLRGGTGEIAALPVKNELSTTQYRVTLKPRADGRADMEIEARYSGEDAIEMREELAPASESGRTEYLQRWLAEARPGASLVSHAFESLDNPDEALQIKMKGEASGLVTLAEGVEVVQGCVLFCYDSNPVSRSARQHPFYVDRGWNTSQEVVILPPEGMKSAEMPVPFAARSAIGSLSARCVSHDEEGVSCSRQFVARRNRWAAAERDGIRAMFDQIVEADRISVAFQAVGAAGK